MCIILKESVTLDEDTAAFKVVYRDMFIGSYAYVSALDPEERAPQHMTDRDGEVFYPNDQGKVVTYKPGTTMTDEDGIGYYLFLSRKAAEEWKGNSSFDVILEATIPAGTEQLIGENGTCIARTIKVGKEVND